MTGTLSSRAIAFSPRLMSEVSTTRLPSFVCLVGIISCR